MNTDSAKPPESASSPRAPLAPAGPPPAGGAGAQAARGAAPHPASIAVHPGSAARRDTIVIVDFGAQYTQLIARRVREEGVFCRIHPCTAPAEVIAGDRASLRGIILSGGPASVYDKDAPQLDPVLLRLGVPVLGICYGLQAAVAALGGEVKGGTGREYGRAELVADGLPGAPAKSIVWMNHGDRVAKLPAGFRTLATSEGCPYAAVEGMGGRFLGLQFHPEVSHSEYGTAMLSHFLHERCGCDNSWEMGSFLEEATATVRAQVKDGRVLCGLSGGVDSSTLAVLLHRALGDRLTCLFVDNGLLRKDEAKQVIDTFRGAFGIKLVAVDASGEFLAALDGVTDPEQKRRVIGKVFIDVFARAAREAGDAQFLAQGTLYPDVIESVPAHGGPTQVIKTHHNVGGLPKDLKFQLVEPFRELFKDEVRRLGTMLGLPDAIVQRHPFPGPGLAVRLPGPISKARLDTLREADAIFREELVNSGWMSRSSQAFAVLLPVRSVGVQGDNRAYADVLALRCVQTLDFMTADWSPLPYELLGKVSNRIINEVPGISRVVYDISSKPPATIEWE
ncbi:MAG TPA: glutamine-hydrolyzing GMP synthase [Planctomycetota bacterium]|nr:glutamine-hydrolyzing GMP synthase [Planctomycetota bacterium]